MSGRLQSVVRGWKWSLVGGGRLGLVLIAW